MIEDIAKKKEAVQYIKMNVVPKIDSHVDIGEKVGHCRIM